MTLLRRLLARRRDDAGTALVLVLGVAALVGGLVAIGTTVGVRTLQSASSHARFEGALAVAEAGVDTTLAAVSSGYNSSPSVDWSTPAACGGTAPASFASTETERRWARDTLTALPAGCLVSVAGGQYAAVRPAGRQTVYSMGWVPSRGARGAESRLLKAEYLFSPFKPTRAVLTQGAIDLSGSVAVTALGTTPSDVHSNTDITGANGSTSIAGSMTATGSTGGSCPSGVTGGCQSGAPLQQVPVISARALYGQSAAYTSQWHDLCPDGSMRSPGATPCTGTVLGTTNGWQFTPGSGTTAPLWTLPRTAGGPFNGIYYAYRSDAQIGDNGNSSTTWRITVLAEAEPTGGPATSCGKRGGAIRWKLFNMQPALPGLQLLADTDLTGDANATAGPGLFLAGHKVDFATSSATMTGAVIAGNTCAAAGGNRIQGVTLRYDDTAESPLRDVVRTTLWLDWPTG